MESSKEESVCAREAPANAAVKHGAASQRWHDFFDNKVPNMVLRIVVMLLGLSCVAFGIALSRCTDLGVSAISSIPGVLDYATSISLGVWTFFFNVGLALLQIVLLRRDYKPLQLIGILFIFVFGWLIDAFVGACSLIPMPHYVVRLFFSLLSCMFIAFGVWLQVKAALILLPGDGLSQTIAAVTGRDFGKTKVVVDVTLIALAVAMSLVSMGGFYGVREGTVIAALIVGRIVHLYERLFGGIGWLIPTEGHITLIADRR